MLAFHLGWSDAFAGSWMHLALSILSFSILKTGMFVYKLMPSSVWHQKKTSRNSEKVLRSATCSLVILQCTELVIKNLYQKIRCLNKPPYAWLSSRTITQLHCLVILWDQSAFFALKEWLSLEQVSCMRLLPTLGLETLRAVTQWCSLSQQHPRKQWKVISILLQRIKFHQFTKMTQVWSLKLLKRTNFLVTYCCSLKETVLLSHIRGFLCCPLKIIGEDPMESINICLPWKAVAFTCTAEQLREVRSVASGRASVWHFTFKRNYKDVFLGNRTESAPRDMDCTAERSELAHGTDSCLVNPVTFVTKRP